MAPGLRRVMLNGLPPPVIGSHAVVAGGLVFAGGFLATDYTTGLAPQARGESSLPMVEPTTRHESAYALGCAKRVLEESGASMDSVVRIDQYITDRRLVGAYLGVRRTMFALPRRPASTLLAVPRLPVPEATIGFDVVAAGAGVEKRGIFTDDVPVNFPGAPHGAIAGPFVFVQGQIASDFRAAVAPGAEDSPFWYQTPVERQADYVFRNLGLILEAGGSSLGDVARANVFLTDLADLAAFEDAWRRHFASAPPARTVVPVSGLGSAGCRVEVSVVGVARGTRRAEVRTARAPSRSPLREPQALRAGDFLFLSGLFPGDFAQGLAAEARVADGVRFFHSEIERQTAFVLRAAAAICEAAGGALDHAVWAQVYLADMRDYHGMSRVWQEVFGDRQPTVGAVEVPALIVPGARIALDLTVYVP